MSEDHTMGEAEAVPDGCTDTPEEQYGVLEMMRCAEINFGNFATAFPGAANHPFFKISMKQLEMAIEALEATGK